MTNAGRRCAIYTRKSSEEGLDPRRLVAARSARKKSESPAPERSDPLVGTPPIPWGWT
jgi:hypothetical protein